jgi:hypothetical protein
MRILTEALKVSHLPWPETLVLQSKDKIDVDHQDGKQSACLERDQANNADLQREMAL